MSHSIKKRFKIGGAAQMQDKASQSKLQQSVSKASKRNRLKVVLKNLSLLKLLKSPNRRIQELYSLAKFCWNSLLRVPRIFQTSSRNTEVCKAGKQGDQQLQKAGSSQSRWTSDKIESEDGPAGSKWSVPALRPRDGSKAQCSGAAVRQQQAEPKDPEAQEGQSRTTCPGRGLRGQLPTGGLLVVSQKPRQHRAPPGDLEQPAPESPWVWFEGLPTRILLPGPRVLCRSSRWRWVNRCCTRSCSLELPVYHPYRVV